MGNPSYRRSIQIATPLSRAWAGLTDPEVLTRWACDDLELDLRPGGAFRPSGAHCVTVESADGQVSAVIPERRLELSWPMAGVATTVSVDLEPLGESTRLALTHAVREAWPNELDPPALWALQLTALRRLLENPGLEEVPLRVDRTLEASDLIWLGLTIASPAARVFEALTQTTPLRAWLGTQARIDARVGGKLDFGWKDNGPTTVLALKKNRLLVHGLRDPALPPDTRITWSIMPERGATRLEFLHEGLGAHPKVSALRLRWTATLAVLQDYVENGRSVGLGWEPPGPQM